MPWEAFLVTISNTIQLSFDFDLIFWIFWIMMMKFFFPFLEDFKFVRVRSLDISSKNTWKQSLACAERLCPWLKCFRSCCWRCRMVSWMWLRHQIVWQSPRIDPGEQIICFEFRLLWIIKLIEFLLVMLRVHGASTVSHSYFSESF